MKKNNRGEIILTEKEFLNIIPDERNFVEELIEIYGSYRTLDDVAEILREIDEGHRDEEMW